VSTRPLLLVLGDSLAFHGPVRAEPANESRLWPNVLAEVLGGRAELFAGFGWTARDAWWALSRDPRVWAVMPHIDAAVLGVGGMDTLPSPLPSYLREGLRYVRPDGLRRRARRGYLAAQPRLARMQARVFGGWPVALPPRVTARYLERCRAALHALRPDLPIVALAPSVHRSAAYGHVHSGRERGAAAVRRWAATAGAPVVDVPSLVGEHIAAGQGNPDGLHWGWPAHAAVGKAVAAALAELGIGAAER
jgi:diglucosylglycerate octanoyltransferase